MRVHLVFLLLINFHLCFADDAGERIVKSHVEAATAELNSANSSDDCKCWDLKTWETKGFAGATVLPMVLDPIKSDIPVTHEASFSVILFRNSGWDLGKVRIVFQRAAEIYAQCGIRFSVPKVVEATAPVGVTAYGVTPDIAQAKQIANLTPATLPKPWVYFVSLPKGNADDFNAYAYTRSEGLDKSHNDTVWIGSRTLTTRYKMDRDPSYSPLAHEIAHVLGDYFHLTGVRNILTGKPVGMANDSITPEQCAKFKTHPSVKSLQ